MENELYNFSVKNNRNEELSLREYAGKVVLIVNTASKCGFTPQYKGLQKLYRTYKDQGFVVLGFPCDQFAHQEPGSDEEIASFCSLNYGVSFPLFKKVNVNGKNADPLFDYLRRAMPGKIGNSVKWNFTKFLLDREGRPVKRFAPNTEPEKLAADIEALL